MKFPDALRNNIALARYQVPTPVQKYSIPVVMSNRDLMACAQTGSGKTAAFLFPVIASLLELGPPDMPPPAAGRYSVYPRILILAPTRELSSQIYEEARKVCNSYNFEIRSCSVYLSHKYSSRRRVRWY